MVGRLMENRGKGAVLSADTTHIEAGITQAAEEVSRVLRGSKDACRVAIAQIATYPGQIERNTAKIISVIEEARRSGAQVVVFPELAIPGYCAMDLLNSSDYVRDNIRALQMVRAASAGITVVVGFVDCDFQSKRPGGRLRLFNSAAIIHDGCLVGVQDKTLLPDYDIFFENRYFEPARAQQVFDAGGLRIGAQICEDMWSAGYSIDPTAALAEQQPDLVVNLSASPFHLGKLPVREALVKRVAAQCGVPFVYANLVGSYDGYEGQVVFDGRSLVVSPHANVLALGKGFKEDLIIVDVHTTQAVALPEVQEVEELYEALVLGIRDYFLAGRPPGAGPFSKAIIGLSGGIDSSVVAALAAEALGPERVLGITMPSQYNSKDTISDAEALARNLGIAFKTSPIGQQMEACKATFQEDPEIQEMPEGVAEENIQARLRMLGLMYYANKLKGVVLNTGNKTELALDNCTIYGDMVGGFSVLGDVDKDRIFQLARYINQRAGREIVPQSVIDRPPTAELKPNQLDAHVMGAAPERIAPMVREMVEENLSFHGALQKYGDEFSQEVIESAFRKLDRSEWKRRQAAPAIRVTSHAFGNGRRMPMNHGYLASGEGPSPQGP